MARETTAFDDAVTELRAIWDNEGGTAGRYAILLRVLRDMIGDKSALPDDVSTPRWGESACQWNAVENQLNIAIFLLYPLFLPELEES